MSGASLDFERGHWSVAGHSAQIEYALSVLDQIRAHAIEGFNKVPHGGIEIGGVLFGERGEKRVSILAARPLACEYALGPSFAGSVTPFNVLAAAGLIVVSQAASSNVLIAVGRHRVVAWIWLLESAANLALSLTLVRTMGLVGVAVGTLVPLVVGHVAVMLTAACRAVGVSVGRCVYETMRPAAVAGGIASLVCAVVRVTWPPMSATAVIVEAAGVGLVYVGSLTTVGFDGETRRAYAFQIGRAATAVVAAIAGSSGRRATNVDPEGPLSSSVSVP